MTRPLPAYSGGRWRAASKRAWAAWWASPVSRNWTPGQAEAAARLLSLVDAADAEQDIDRRIRLQKEVRIGEAALGLGKPPSAKPQPEDALDRDEAEAQRDARRIERSEYKKAQRAACDEVGVTVDEFELAALDDHDAPWVERVNAILRDAGWDPMYREKI